nr:hypothetical protein GCM10025732_18640 [Glycomyces mayteni]
MWVDCEMTGLDPDTEALIEIAVLVTGPDLEPLDEGIDIVIACDEAVLGNMGAFVADMHAKSGLTDEVRASKISLADAEDQVLEYVKRFVPEARTAPCAATPSPRTARSSPSTCRGSTGTCTTG